jgi:hypothetical protein
MFESAKERDDYLRFQLSLLRVSLGVAGENESQSPASREVSKIAHLLDSSTTVRSGRPVR